MKSNLNTLFLFLLVCTCTNLLRAEEANVSVTFCLFSPGQEIKKVDFKSNGKLVTAELAEGRRSAPQTYEGPKLLELQETDGEKRIFQVELSPNESGPLLILLLNGPGTPRAVAIEDSLKDFPSNTIRFSNQTIEKFDVSATLIQTTLEPGETSLFSLPEKSRTSFIRISRAEGKDIVYSSNWSLVQNTRTLAILVPSTLENNPNPTVVRLTENLSNL